MLLVHMARTHTYIYVLCVEYSFEGKHLIFEALKHQRLHFDSVTKGCKSSQSTGKTDETAMSGLLWQHSERAREKGGRTVFPLEEFDAASNMVSTLVMATDTLCAFLTKESTEAMLLEAADIARKYGNAQRARIAAVALSNLYSDGQILLIRQLSPASSVWVDQSPEKKAWRLTQAALLRSEIDDIAAITGRAVETECPICLDPLESCGDAGGMGVLPEPVYIFPSCFHRLHVECAMSKHKSDFPRLSLTEVKDIKLTCPTCRY